MCHYPRDGGDIPVPKVKKLIPLCNTQDVGWMEKLIKKCLSLNL